MNSSDKIKALCEEALKSPDPTEDQPASPGESPAVEHDENTITEKTPAHATESRTDAELTAELEERDKRLKGKAKRIRMVANVCLLAFVVLPLGAVMINPTLREKFSRMAGRLGEGVEDVKMLKPGTGNYDEAMDEIAQRGKTIDDATVQLGVDPARVTAEDDAKFNAEIAETTGQDPEAFKERQKKMEKLGKAAKAISD